MNIEILDEAQEDLKKGFRFYESRDPTLGLHFLDSLFSDIDSLLGYAGIHQMAFGYYRCLSKRFPFAIYYTIEEDVIRIHAVLDCRQNPSRTKIRLMEDA